jgi:hypothetical protein
MKSPKLETEGIMEEIICLLHSFSMKIKEKVGRLEGRRKRQVAPHFAKGSCYGLSQLSASLNGFIYSRNKLYLAAME